MTYQDAKLKLYEARRKATGGDYEAADRLVREALDLGAVPMDVQRELEGEPIRAMGKWKRKQTEEKL